tara:strand:+ start:396 stop:551 length:156 start_codon:yes stop_codon:yes gene_type:complete
MWFKDDKEIFEKKLNNLFAQCDKESRIEFEESDRGKFLWNEFDKAMKEQIK